MAVAAAAALVAAAGVGVVGAVQDGGRAPVVAWAAAGLPTSSELRKPQPPSGDHRHGINVLRYSVCSLFAAFSGPIKFRTRDQGLLPRLQQ